MVAPEGFGNISHAHRRARGDRVGISARQSMDGHIMRYGKDSLRETMKYEPCA